MSNRRFLIFYFIFLSVLTAVLTWPLVLDLKNSTYGYPGDNFGHIYYLWWWRKSLFEKLNIRFLPLQEAPFGEVVPQESGSIVFYWPTYVLAYFLDEVTTYNLLLLLSFPLSGIWAYGFFREISGQRAASLVFSLVFAFSPYHFWKAYNHLDLSMVQYIPLFLWSLVRLEKAKTLKRAIICGLCLAVLVLLNFYYGYFALLTVLVFWVVLTLSSLVRHRRFELTDMGVYAVTVLVTIILTVPFTWSIFKNFFVGVSDGAAAEVYARPLDNLLLLSARPWSYLLPSIDNPFLGNLSSKIYAGISQLSRDFKTATPFPHETTVFLGFFSWSFFLLTLILWKLQRLKQSLLLPLLITISALVLVSMPPFILIRGLMIKLPTFYLHQYLPMFRSYGRLGIFVLPLFAALSSLSYAWLIRSLSRRKRYFVALVSVIFVLVEFTNVPPWRVVSFAKLPAVYAWLRDQEDDPIVLEYPEEFNLAEGQLFQRIHLKKTANWHSQSPYFGLWNQVDNIYSAESFEILAGLGVTHVFFHEKLLFNQANPVDDLWHRRAYATPVRRDKLPENIDLIGEFDGVLVYRLRPSRTIKVVIITSSPGSRIKTEIIGGANWFLDSPGTLYVINLSARSVQGQLSAGKQQKFVRIPPGQERLSFPVGDYNLSLALEGSGELP